MQNIMSNLSQKTNKRFDRSILTLDLVAWNHGATKKRIENINRSEAYRKSMRVSFMLIAD